MKASFMMIRLSAQYGHGPIDLLYEEQTHHLMIERHLRQGYPRIGTVIDRFRKSVRTSHRKHDPAPAGSHHLLHVTGKLHGCVLCAPLIEKHQVIRLRHTRQHQLALPRFLHLLTHGLRSLHIRKLLQRKRHIMTQASRVLTDTIQYKPRTGLSYRKQCNIHSGSICLFI